MSKRVVGELEVGGVHLEQPDVGDALAGDALARLLEHRRGQVDAGDRAVARVEQRVDARCRRPPRARGRPARCPSAESPAAGRGAASGRRTSRTRTRASRRRPRRSRSRPPSPTARGSRRRTATRILVRPRRSFRSNSAIEALRGQLFGRRLDLTRPPKLFESSTPTRTPSRTVKHPTRLDAAGAFDTWTPCTRSFSAAAISRAIATPSAAAASGLPAHRIRRSNGSGTRTPGTSLAMNSAFRRLSNGQSPATIGHAKRARSAAGTRRTPRRSKTGLRDRELGAGLDLVLEAPQLLVEIRAPSG